MTERSARTTAAAPPFVGFFSTVEILTLIESGERQVGYAGQVGTADLPLTLSKCLSEILRVLVAVRVLFPLPSLYAELTTPAIASEQRRHVAFLYHAI